MLGISPSQIPRKASEIFDYRSDTGICCRSKISAGCIELGALVSIYLEASNTLELVLRAIVNLMRIHETDGGYVSSATGALLKKYGMPPRTSPYSITLALR